MSGERPGKRRRGEMPAAGTNAAVPAHMFAYKEDNPFNRMLKGTSQPLSTTTPLLFERPNTFAILDPFPLARGHSVLVSKAKAATLLDELPDDAAADLMKDLQALVRAVQRALGCPGVRVSQANGPSAGQVVPQLHFNVVPCWSADVQADAASAPSSLERSQLQDADAGPLIAAIRNSLPAPYAPGYHAWAANADEMEALGWALQQACYAGAVVLLKGQLGAGKSTLSRGFVRAFCRDPGLEVPSPTFLLCLSYQDDVHTAHVHQEQQQEAAVEPAAPAQGSDASTSGREGGTSVSSTSSALVRAPRVHHMDPYRLGAKSDKMAGLIDFGSAFTHDICLIEWPDRMPQEVMALARAGLNIHVSGMGTQASGRLITISPLEPIPSPKPARGSTTPATAAADAAADAASAAAPAAAAQAPEAPACQQPSSATPSEAQALHAQQQTEQQTEQQRQHYERLLAGWRTAHPGSLPPAEVSWREGVGSAGLSDPNLSPQALQALQGDPTQWIVLGIESSCDDTAAAIVRGDGTVLGHKIASQAGLHEQYGGVKPDVACQAHAAAIRSTVDACMEEAGISPGQLTAVAVTAGPGLALCLQVGVRHALQLSWRHQLPLVPVHHMEAHAFMTCLPGVADPPVAFPALLLLVSGGHNMLVLCEGVGKHRIIGTTLDDSVGECFDKIARIVGISAIPGGPHLERLAATGDPKRYPLPLPLTNGSQKDTCNFSFSGLKTQVSTILLARKKELGLDDPPSGKPNVANGAEAAAAVVAQWTARKAAEAVAEAEAAASAADGAGVAPMQTDGSAAMAAADGSIGSSRAEAEAEFQRTAADVSSSFQTTAVRFLQQRTRRALQWLADDARQLGGGFVKSLVVAGGVAANQAVREGLSAVAAEFGIPCVFPPIKYCTDNGIMVAWTGVERLKLRLYHAPPPPERQGRPADGAAQQGGGEAGGQAAADGVTLEGPGELDRHVQVLPRWPIGPMDPRSAVGKGCNFLKILH